jgi:hypothetical protein
VETRVVIISDTHCRHDEIDLPAGDLLIHCGDMFSLSMREPSWIGQMDDWFGRQPFERIICTGGNHDRLLEAAVARRPQPFSNAVFLDGDALEFRGLRIFGAPWVPDLAGHAFYRSPQQLAHAWARVPAGIDILVTHTPPEGILDRSSRGWSLGCPDLARELTRIAPRVHCFGHVHAGAGRIRVGATLFINACSLESGTERILPAATLTLSSRTGRGAATPGQADTRPGPPYLSGRHG